MKIDIQIVEKLNGANNAVDGTDIKASFINFTDVKTELEITRAIQILKKVKEILTIPLSQNQVS